MILLCFLRIERPILNPGFDAGMDIAVAGHGIRTDRQELAIHSSNAAALLCRHTDLEGAADTACYCCAGSTDEVLAASFLLRSEAEEFEPLP